MGEQQDQKSAPRKRVVVDKEQSRKGTFTPEMWEVAEALAHPAGDPYENARKMGFYCEQCG